MDSPIMYYSLDVGRVIPSVSPGCGRRLLGRCSSPNVGEKKSSRNSVFTTNKNPDRLSRARAYLRSRFANREVGGGLRKMAVAFFGGDTPPKKTHPGSLIKKNIAY